MVTVEVKTVWQGMVAVRDRIVNEARQSKQGLIIVHGQDKMIIPHIELKKRIARVSEGRFKDHYGRSDPNRLIYYPWKPDIKQESLLPK